MKTAPTLQTIADATGFHRMTVSRALRNDPSIPTKTRDKIREKADELGYRPNPLVSALMAQLRTTKPPSFRATLAWINDHPGVNPWKTAPYMRPYYEGAVDRASQLGFQLEEIAVPYLESLGPQAHVTQIRRILNARGIPGLVLPLNYRPHLSKQNWSGFSVAVLGRHKSNIDYPVPGHPREPIPHSVAEDYYYNMRLACLSLRELGYKRIGWVSNRWFDTSTDSLYTAAYDQEQLGAEPANRIPSFCFADRTVLGPTPPAGLDAWFSAHKPDVILGRFGEMNQWIKALKLGQHTPDYAHLGLADDVKGWSGIDTQMHVLGAAAVDMVVAQINRNERETPEHPKEVLIRGTWVTGKTTRGAKEKQ